MRKRSLVLLGALLVTMTLSTTASGEGIGYKSLNSWFWWSKARYQTADVKSLTPDNIFANIGAVTLVRERNKISGRIMANVSRCVRRSGQP